VVREHKLFRGLFALLLTAASSQILQAAPVLGSEECPAPDKACEAWRQQHQLLAWIKVENAESDAAAAIAAGDFRLYGLHGVGPVVPEAGHAGLLPNGCSVRMIEGTSDYIADGESAFRAVEYAKRYNQAILSNSHCLSKPISRKGMRWSGYISDDYQNLAFGNGGYDLVFFYCDRGKLGLTLTRPRVAFQNRQLEIESGGLSARAQTEITLLPSDFQRSDLANIGAKYFVRDPVFSAFFRTGSVDIAGERFDVSSDEERAAVRNFVTTCRMAD
jgi:hypothetical protein